MSTTMTAVERETFLAGVRVGVLSIAEPGRGPLTAPIWYAYEPGGELWFVTGRDSRKGRLLRTGERVSLCAQSETPPYRYASVEGPITAVEPSHLDPERILAHRYLGPELGERYVEETAGDRPGNAVVRMRPERWLTADYGKAFPV